MKYKDKLKDPRWQKRRLEILERDNWQCQWCKNTKQTLVVHHLHYYADEPWDDPDEALLTVCETCHDHDYKVRHDFEKDLVERFKKYSIYQIRCLIWSLFFKDGHKLVDQLIKQGKKVILNTFKDYKRNPELKKTIEIIDRANRVKKKQPEKVDFSELEKWQ